MDKIYAAQVITEIDWTNPKAGISKHFTVRDAIWLDKWGRLATAEDGLSDQVKINIVLFFNNKVEPVRVLIDRPMFSKSCFRPPAYNKLIGGAKLSCHKFGLESGQENDDAALDFWCDVDGDGDKDGEDCDQLKDELRPHLESLGIRMENNGVGAKWVHIDNKEVPVGGNREFWP